MAPPRPGRFSTAKGWPTFADTCSSNGRGRRSVALPGANGTTTWTRFVGQVWAGMVCAASGAAASSMNPAIAAQAAVARTFVRLCMQSFSIAPPPVRTCVIGGRSTKPIEAYALLELVPRTRSSHESALQMLANFGVGTLAGEEDEFRVAPGLGAAAVIRDAGRRAGNQQFADAIDRFLRDLDAVERLRRGRRRLEVNGRTGRRLPVGLPSAPALLHRRQIGRAHV